MEYTMTIPNESEKHLPALDNIIHRFGLRPNYNETKDGFIYDFQFLSLAAQEKFKAAVLIEIPNLYSANKS